MRDRYYKGCKYIELDNNLRITMSDSSDIDILVLKKIISSYNIKSITFSNIVTVKNLKLIFNTIRSLNFNGKIVVDMHSFINTDTGMGMIYRTPIEGLNNRVYIDLNNIPSNVELKAFSKYHDQDEFTTWVHNLNEENKQKIYKMLNEEEKNYYIEEELVIKKFYLEIISVYPNIKELSKKEQFNKIFDYFMYKYEYADECVESGRIKPDCHYAQDPVKTFYKKRGVCAGRAGLLTLVTNNDIFRLNCTIANGMYDSKYHVWNIYLDENGKSTDFDLSFGRKDKSKEEMISLDYKYRRIYPSVVDRIPPTLPKRLNAVPVIKPLPPRKKNKN